MIEFIFFNIPGVSKNSSVRNFARIHWSFLWEPDSAWRLKINDNPNVATFVQGTVSIRAHGSASLQPLGGNITAMHYPEFVVDETPLKKRPRKEVISAIANIAIHFLNGVYSNTHGCSTCRSKTTSQGVQ